MKINHRVCPSTVSIKKNQFFILSAFVIFLLIFLALIIVASKQVVFANNNNTGNNNLVNAETIDEQYLLVKGVPGTVELSNFIKLGMEPISHVMYIYGGGWNEADDGGGIEANTIGVVKSFKDFERKQDYNYTNLIDALDYTIHKEVIHYGFDCSAFIGWIYHNFFNDGKDHVTFASDMGEELVEKGLATKTRDIDASSGVCSFTPGDIMTSGSHVWICLGKCSDGSVLALQSQGVAADVNLDKYEGVSIYGTTTPDGSKNSQAICLATTYLNKYYQNFANKYKQGYSNVGLLTKFNEYTWNSSLDLYGLQNKSANEVMSFIFNETYTNVTSTFADYEPTIMINDAVVSANTGISQSYNQKPTSKDTVDITLKVPFTKEITSVSINGVDYSTFIPKSSAELSQCYKDLYTLITIPNIAKCDSYNISTSCCDAKNYGVGVTTWSYGDKIDSNGIDFDYENVSSIFVEQIQTNTSTIKEPIYYSSTDWINDNINGYGAFPVNSKVKIKVVPMPGYKIDSIGNASMNIVSTGVENEYEFIAPPSIFTLDIKTSLIENKQEIVPSNNPTLTDLSSDDSSLLMTAKTPDPVVDFIREMSYNFFAILSFLFN